MQNFELEAETLQISIYVNIVLNMLKSHTALSVSKVLLFAYLVKKEKFRLGKIYLASNKQDIVYKAISLLYGEYAEYCENVKFILKAIHLLIQGNRIQMNNTLLSIKDGVEVEKSVYQEAPFLEKAIEESKKISDRQFMKEVIASV